VTNGNINRKPAQKLLPYMDALNIDLKSWNRDYYRNILGGSLDTVRAFIEESVKYSWVELTSLIVPGDNDLPEDMKNMVRWIASVSDEIPLHLSAYHPAYKYRVPGTDAQSMLRMKKTAEEKLHFVYLGNLGMENNTLCPECSDTVIRRSFHTIESLLEQGHCRNCGTEIPGVFPEYSVPDDQT
jgi:pyruvate formate lyase activating enzyme